MTDDTNSSRKTNILRNSVVHILTKFVIPIIHPKQRFTVTTHYVFNFKRSAKTLDYV